MERILRLMCYLLHLYKEVKLEPQLKSVLRAVCCINCRRHTFLFFCHGHYVIFNKCFIDSLNCNCHHLMRFKTVKKFQHSKGVASLGRLISPLTILFVFCIIHLLWRFPKSWLFKKSLFLFGHKIKP